jgi:glycosyltransferase involved in cell wall biosynthesis
MMEKRVYPRVDMLLALTPKYAEYLIRMGGDRSKVELLVFPIDIELFNSNSECLDLRARWGIRPSDKAIVFVGTLYEFSGLGDFIRKFPAVLKEVPEAKLVIVGDGPLRPSLDKIVDELNLRNHVAITGYQPFADMPRYIGMATMCLNVFPITERTKDIFSAKIIQYLACGKATVSSSLPGITTLISSGVVYAENTDRMVEEVVSLLKSPEKRDLLGQAGRKYIEDSHSHTKVILRLENALQRIVRNAGTERTGTAK